LREREIERKTLVCVSRRQHDEAMRERESDSGRERDRERARERQGERENERERQKTCVVCKHIFVCPFEGMCVCVPV